MIASNAHLQFLPTSNFVNKQIYVYLIIWTFFIINIDAGIRFVVPFLLV